MGRGTESCGMNAETRIQGNKQDNRSSLDFRWKTHLPVEGLHIFMPAEIKRVNIKQKELFSSAAFLS